MDTREALRLAQEMDLDLVLVGPNADPPVARIGRASCRERVSSPV